MHGYPRATVDLDIWVRSTTDNAARIIETLKAFGFDTPSLVAGLFLDPRSIVRLGVPPFRIELMTAIDSVAFDDCRARGQGFDVDGVVVPVISLADLKVNKRAAGRHKDLADLEHLP